MNPFLARAIAVQRKLEDGLSTDELDAEIIDFALQRLIREGRIPFQRFRDHIVLGTERWKLLDGLDYYRTILMHRRSDVWYPHSEMSELSVFSVYAASQVEPPDENVYDADRGKPSEYADEFLNDAEKSAVSQKRKIGPSISSSYQQLLEEAPPDWRAEAIGTVQQNLRKYAKELSAIDTETAREKRDELEAFLRKHTKGKTKEIPDGALNEVMDAYLSTHVYQGRPRAIRGPKQMVCDNVRRSCKYALEKLQESDSPMSVAIGEHLQDQVVIGQTCEYRGDWKWRF